MQMKDYLYTATITRIVVSLTSMDMQNHKVSFYAKQKSEVFVVFSS